MIVLGKDKYLNQMQKLREHASDILNSENFLSSDKNIQHGEISVMEHSIKVALKSLYLNEKYNLKCDERLLSRGALLHDYFLYDWHSPEHAGFKNLHGFKHPKVALKNAREEYDLSPVEEDIIVKHMWPMTVVPPKYREAWVVTFADKCISTAESIHFIQSAKRRKKYININT